MMKIKERLIHLFGGITKRESTDKIKREVAATRVDTYMYDHYLDGIGELKARFNLEHEEALHIYVCPDNYRVYKIDGKETIVELHATRK